MLGVVRRPRRVLSALGRTPARAVVGGFAIVAVAGMLLLLLPVATESGRSTGLVAALFTAVSALCLTGLIVVDTPEHWSLFGELVILGLIQAGGLGILTLASLLGLLIARRLRLRLQLTAQTETKALGLSDVRSVIRGVVVLSVTVESVVAVILALRLAFGYGEPASRAIYLGVFHAVSAFNNAGFALYSDSLIGFATDPLIWLPVIVAVILGGIGFPVIFEVARRLRGQTKRWSLHLQVTVSTYAILLVIGVLAFVLAEWSNPATLGQFDTAGKLQIGLFHGITPRTAGFNTIDVGELYPATLLITDVLMFIGGGSAGTAGGIKVTTFALLAFIILAEIRGEPTVHVLHRRLPAAVQRQALTVALLGVGLVVSATLVLLSITPFRLDDVLFEVTSAFGTVGLSTGITAQLPPTGQLVLTVLMFAGRLGPITLATALALRERVRRYERPEERTIVG